MPTDNRNRIIIILVIVIILLVSFISYLKIRDYNNNNLNLAYQTGIRDASLQIQQNIITQLNNFGFFSITLPAENNKTMNLKLVPAQQPAAEEQKK